MATEQRQVYKCNVCGIVAEVLDGGAGELVCCGRPMARMNERTADPAAEKHVPHVEKVEGGYRVRVGQNEAHPMEPKHFIQWIELRADETTCRRFLRPGEAPEATFAVRDAASVSAREFCNVHGLWEGRRP